ncbi:GGDEF domain-containing protein [Endothiovibrio diazotrophicus]
MTMNPQATGRDLHPLDLHHLLWGNLALAMESETTDGEPTLRLVTLLQDLQTTLDVESLIRLFSSGVRPLVSHGGLAYRHPIEELEELHGVCSGHQCGGVLTINGEPLGRLTYYRGHPFDEEERRRLLRLSGLLAHPLRNALLYRRAIQGAYVDPLTGIGNRGAFDEALLHEVSLARRQGAPLSLAVADIDRFKAINDHFGHTTGDCALQSLVESAQHCIREADSLFRYGGEEFVILLRDTPLEGAARLAERLRDHVDGRHHPCGDLAITMTVSIGVAQWLGGESGTELFKRADAALYRAKHEGRNRVIVAE